MPLKIVTFLALSLIAHSVISATEPGPKKTDFQTLNKEAVQAVSQKNWQKARSLFEKALEKDPENPFILANLGSVFYQLNDFKKATHCLEKAVAQDASLDQSWMILGLIYHHGEQPNRALAALGNALHFNPKNARAHNHLAVIILQRGWDKGAEAELLKAIALDPQFSEAHFNLALLYAEKKPPAIQLAKKYYNRALELGAEKDPLLEKQLTITSP